MHNCFFESKVCWITLAVFKECEVFKWHVGEVAEAKQVDLCCNSIIEDVSFEAFESYRRCAFHSTTVGDTSFTLN